MMHDQPRMDTGSYLLVFGPSGSRRIPLPEEGEVALSPDGGGNLAAASGEEEPLVRIVVDPDRIRIIAAAPGAVVLVDGAPLAQDGDLSSGREVRIGEHSLIVRRHLLSRPRASALDPRGFEVRLRQEAERAMRYGRPLAVLVLVVGNESGEAAAARERILGGVRFVDVVGEVAPGELAVLLPETGAAATVPAERLLRAVTGEAPEARAGLARFPDDASSAEALLAGARAAAREAAPGSVNVMGPGTGTIEIGARRFVAADQATRRVFELARSLATTDLPVLVLGETGAGKDVVVTALHEWSPRSKEPLVSINCAAMTETLLESELFGHERGAFTGAVAAKPGLLESARGGTVFLDEIGEASPRTQAELLRVLETRRARRVGAVNERTIRARVVAATNRDLEAQINAGRFRRDLFYRLGAATVVLPPLRDRPLDIARLIDFFLDESKARSGLPRLEIAARARQRLLLHDWPGNVRELANLMEYLAATARDPLITADLLPKHIGATAAPWLMGTQSSAPAAKTASPAVPAPEVFRPLAEEIAELERLRMKQALEVTGGVRNRAAALLCMPIRTFADKLKRYGLHSVPSTRK